MGGGPETLVCYTKLSQEMVDNLPARPMAKPEFLNDSPEDLQCALGNSLSGKVPPCVELMERKGTRK